MKSIFQYHFKLLIIGESNVGKTCILLRYTENVFSTNQMSTIGIDFKNKNIVIDDKKIRLQIWDTAGQDRYKTMTKQFYKSAEGIILVYDITHKESFKNVKNWIDQIDQNANEKIFKVLMANKCDLVNERVITTEEGKALAEEYSMYYVETSASKDIGINDCFEYIAGELVKIKDKSHHNTKETKPIILNMDNQGNTCC